VQLIQAAGPRCRVVLSSTWRLPKHAARKQYLESCITWHLGHKFAFDDCTALANESCPVGRLECLGNYIGSFCPPQQPRPSKLRILVLDDFFGSPLTGLSCEGVSVDSTAAAELYLLAKAGDAKKDVEVRVINTSDGWLSVQGAEEVQIGCGLTGGFFREAADFFGSSCLPLPPLSHAPNHSKTGKCAMKDGTNVIHSNNCNNGNTADTDNAATLKTPLTRSGFGVKCEEMGSALRRISRPRRMRLTGRMPCLINRYMSSARAASPQKDRVKFRQKE